VDIDLENILKKPGSEWTPAERRIVNEAMKTHGRQALKEIRKELNGQ
jgi:hypothetical protein